MRSCSHGAMCVIVRSRPGIGKLNGGSDGATGRACPRRSVVRLLESSAHSCPVLSAGADPMAAPPLEKPAAAEPGSDFKPYVADNVTMPEFTVSAVLLGTSLGLIFAASSLYLVLKVGMTVSASIPVAVLAITLFRGF